MENAAENSGARLGKYVFVNALSRRIKGLHSGDKPLVGRPTVDLTAVAVEEMKQNKLRVKRLMPESGISETDQESSAE